MKTYKLCLVGFGNVGRALVRLLQEKTPDLREKYDIDWCITGVATRRLGWLADPNGLNLAALLAGGFSPDPASPVLHTSVLGATASTQECLPSDCLKRKNVSGILSRRSV